jgi:ABC-type Mn2+/Zn2+ transport system ATPase subunit
MGATGTTAGTATVAADLSKQYRKGRPWVLDHLDLCLEPGTVTLVVGANGSGKTTLLRVLAGLVRPTSGRVSQRPAQVAYVPERLPSRLNMTARCYLGHMARLHHLAGADAGPRMEALAQSLAVRPGLDMPITILSKGNRQKVLLVQALLCSSGLLLLDEPANGLDPTTTEALYHELAVASGTGATVLVTAHGTEVLLPVPDQALVLSGGRLEADLDRCTGRPLPGPGDAPATVTVDLLPPRDCADDGLPSWGGIESVVGSGELWRLQVRPAHVDALLARALAAGWSVHRVEPPDSPVATAPQIREAQIREAQIREAQIREAHAQEPRIQ